MVRFRLVSTIVLRELRVELSTVNVLVASFEMEMAHAFLLLSAMLSTAFCLPQLPLKQR